MRLTVSCVVLESIIFVAVDNFVCSAKKHGKERVSSKESRLNLYGSYRFLRCLILARVVCLLSLTVWRLGQ